MDDGEPLTDNEDILSLQDLTEDCNFHMTSISKGKVAIKETVRTSLGLDATDEKPIVIFEHPELDGVFGGKIIEESEVIQLLNGE